MKVTIDKHSLTVLGYIILLIVILTAITPGGLSFPYTVGIAGYWTGVIIGLAILYCFARWIWKMFIEKKES